MLRATEYTEFIKMAATRLKLGPGTSARHVWLAKIRRDEGEYFKVKDITKVRSLHLESSEIKKGFDGKWSQMSRLS